MSLNVQIAVGVALASVLLPLVFRVLLSPLSALIIVPTLFILTFIACASFSIIIGIFLDRFHPNRRQSLAHSSRPLAFSTPAAWEAVQTRSRWVQKSTQTLPLLRPNFPLVSSSTNEIVGFVTRDFVQTWYSGISTSPAFPNAVAGAVHQGLSVLLTQVESLDLASFIVRRILPKLTSHVNQFKLSETALRGAGLERHLTQSEELDLLLASRYAGKGGKLHPAIDNLSTTFTRQTEEAHLRRLADLAIPYLLHRKDGNSKTVRLVVREIIACTVLAPITDMLSDPDFWNRTIDQLVCFIPRLLCSRTKSF